MPKLKPPALLALTAANVPPTLRGAKRWAPWRAEYDAKRGKYDKIPVYASRPERGISSADPDRWADFDIALAAHRAADGMLAGVGYVMTRPHGIVGVDIDDAIHDDGKLAGWARAIVQRLGGYAEVSPSGRGVRVFVRGEIPGDYVNNDAGVEVYAGHAPRFLTLTGARLEGSPLDVPDAPPGALEWLAQTYRPHDRPASMASRNAPPVPEVPDVLELPEVDYSELSPRARDFLQSGEYEEDRSRTLHSTAVNLFACGFNRDEVFGILANNPHALEVALDHRHQKHERALVYLWVEHCVKAEAKAPRVLSESDFDDYSGDFQDTPDTDEPGVAAGSDDSDFADETGAQDAPSAPARKARKFAFCSAEEFVAQGGELEWFIDGVLPRAELAAIFGASGSGKTFLALDMVGAICQGADWFGRPTKKARVGYITAEGQFGFKSRIRAWCDYHGVPVSDLDLCVLADAPNMLDADETKILAREVKAAAPDLLVVDTMAQVTPGANENSSEDMGRLIRHCRLLNKVTGATVLLIAHSGKDSGRGVRGWSGIKGALDAEIEVVKLATHRTASVTKLKDGEGEGVEYPFKLETVTLDAPPAKDGEPEAPSRSSCIIAPLDSAQVAAAEQQRAERSRKLGAAQAAYLEAMREHWAATGGASSTFGEMVDTLRGAHDSKPGVIRSALKALAREGLLRFADGDGDAIQPPEGWAPAASDDDFDDLSEH